MTGTHQSEFDLPVSMCRDVGRIMTRWSYIEYVLQSTIYMLCNVGPEVGRLAIREPRIQDRLDLILDLIAFRQLQVPKLAIEWKDLRSALIDGEDLRNVVAHSVWFRSPKHNAWAAHVARGSWPDRKRTDRAKRNKRISPEGQIIHPSTLSGYVKALEGSIMILKNLRSDVEAQLASHQKRP